MRPTFKSSCCATWLRATSTVDSFRDHVNLVNLSVFLTSSVNTLVLAAASGPHPPRYKPTYTSPCSFQSTQNTEPSVERSPVLSENGLRATSTGTPPSAVEVKRTTSFTTTGSDDLRLGAEPEMKDTAAWVR